MSAGGIISAWSLITMMAQAGRRCASLPRAHQQGGWTAPTGEVFTAHSYDGLWKTDATSSEHVLAAEFRGIETLWASPEGDIFVAGESAYRFDGENWIDLNKESITSNWVYGIDGLASDDLYAVGHGMILHYAMARCGTG